MHGHESPRRDPRSKGGATIQIRSVPPRRVAIRSSSMLMSESTADPPRGALLCHVLMLLGSSLESVYCRKDCSVSYVTCCCLYHSSCDLAFMFRLPSPAPCDRALDYLLSKEAFQDEAPRQCQGWRKQGLQMFLHFGRGIFSGIASSSKYCRLLCRTTICLSQSGLQGIMYEEGSAEKSGLGARDRLS